jgi:high-affinity iron transporter
MRRPVLLVLLLLAAVAPATAAAAPVAPWRAGAEVRERLFAAESALLLKDAGAAAEVRAASRAYAGPLRTGLARRAPGAHRAVVRGLRTAAAARTPLALAAARGRVEAALHRGAADVALAAVRAREVRTARAWLLLREFRATTRYSRPVADATVALRDLAKRRVTPGEAATTVTKDLLDATQGRARERVEEIGRLGRQGFAARRAELAARVAGVWPLLAPRLEADQGARAAAAGTRGAQALARAAARDDDAAVDRATAAMTKVLGSFTAAPLTEQEQARRAIQLGRFVGLIPVEWDHAVEDDRVTQPFEIQEGLAFSRAARAAFADLESVLHRRGAAQTEKADAGLAELDAILRRAQEHPKDVPSVDAVEQKGERLQKRLERIYPDEWNERSDEGDFDLVQISLDRLEQQVARRQYRLAEQTRVELYAIFEFGPERRLQAFDPGLAADIEGLIWFGARGKVGLAQLVDRRASTAAVRSTRTELDQRLSDAAATLGDGASEVTVVTNAALIVFREGLEAVLILAAITATFRRAQRSKRRPVLWGSVAGLGVSILTFVLALTLLDSLQQYGEKLEAVVGVVAIVVLLLVMNWFFHRVYWTEWISSFHKRRKTILGRDESAKIAFWSAQVVGLFVLGLTSVYREGFETVLFLQSLELSAGLRATVLGALLGLCAVGVVAWLTFRLESKLPYKKMLIVTGMLLTFVLVVMSGTTVRTMQGAGWLPIHSVDIDPPYWLGTWFGFFPTVETIAAQALSVVIVIGSYVAAEYVRVKRPRKRRMQDAPPGQEGVVDPVPRARSEVKEPV